MYHPEPPLFGMPEPCTAHCHIYPRDDGYVDLIVSITPRHKVDTLERATYARLTLEEAMDVLHAQVSLLMAAESPG